MTRKPVRMFLCSTAYEYELGSDFNGTTLYPSVNALREQCGCITHRDPDPTLAAYDCDVVEVSVAYEATLSVRAVDVMAAEAQKLDLP